MKWHKLSRDYYQSSDKRFIISRLEKCDNKYANRDEWTLIENNEGVDVFPLLRDAKAFAEQLASNRS